MLPDPLAESASSLLFAQKEREICIYQVPCHSMPDVFGFENLGETIRAGGILFSLPTTEVLPGGTEYFCLPHHGSLIMDNTIRLGANWGSGKTAAFKSV